jgi:alpha-beta hydrolase superfamily lysophospholipase
MTSRLFFKRFLWFLLLLIFCINVVALFHAYKLTHFDATATRKIENAYGLSTADKLGLVLTGADMPRPKNKTWPARPYQTVRLKSNKAIECWYIPRDSAKGTVALFHGYGGEKSGMLDKAEVFRQLGYNTLLVDFMGAGGSEGVQTTIGYKEAQQVKTCVDYLLQKGEKNIVLFGTSMGAAAVMKAMDDHSLPVRSLVLECPFSSMLQTVKNRFAMMGAPSFPLAHVLVFWGGAQNGFNAFAHNPAEYAKDITTPTLLLWGEKDDRVKRQETAEIFQRLAGPKKLVTYPEAGHENYLSKYKEQWTGDVAQFLDSFKK